MNSKESKDTLDTNFISKIDFSSVYIPKIYDEISSSLHKTMGQLTSEIGNYYDEISSSLYETMEQFTAEIGGYVELNQFSGIESCIELMTDSLPRVSESMKLTMELINPFQNVINHNFQILEGKSLDIFQVEATSSIGSISGSLTTIGLDISTLGSLASIQTGLLCSTAYKNFDATKLLSVRSLIPSQIEISRNRFHEQVHPQKIQTHSLLESEKIKKRYNLYKGIQLIVCDKHSDYLLNFEAYGFLYDLEVSLRNLIRVRIIDPYKKNLSNKIPQKILDSWKDKKMKEKPDSLENDSDLIEYSDFTDLKTIFEKGNNKELFNDIFTGEDMKVLTSKLGELNPIRKKIAHSRALTMNELYRLILYCDDILSCLPQ